MNKFKGMMTSLSPHWATPKWLYAELNKEFNFDFDPCPLGGGIDGLSIPWGMRNYINPPYGRTIGLWIKKAYENPLSVMLLPARTDTKWFHEYCMKADEIRWIKGRLKFGDAKNSAPFPSMIIIFRSHLDNQP
jgi:site-specific DNA-methyltransferase (adenine-specific)